jgi:Rieske Fe-S protein
MVQTPRPSRRALLRWLTLGSAALPLAWLSFRQLFPWFTGAALSPQKVLVGAVDEVFASSDVVCASVGGTPAALIRTRESVEARSLVCTHGQCIVAYDRERSCFVCPCHGGMFEKDGRVRCGPPTVPLQRLFVSVHDNIIYLSNKVIS